MLRGSKRVEVTCVSFSELENDTLNQAELNEIKIMKTIKYLRFLD
jgi:hypothetical protein